MGFSQSKQYVSESELSSPESDSEYFRDTVEPSDDKNSRSEDEQMDSDDRTDAALRIASFPSTENITVEDVGRIEEELDLYEVVSLVYLLYDTPDLALQVLQLLVISKNNPGLICRWANNEANRRWQNKFVEALCIIQNYQILRKMGYKKEDLKAQYLPRREETSCFVDRRRKLFYLIAEKLGLEKTRKFILNMNKKLGEIRIPVRDFDENYLEMYFLYWEQIRLDIKHIKYIFKVIDLEEYCDLLNSLMPPESIEYDVEPVSPIILEKPVKSRKMSTRRDNTYLQRTSLEENMDNMTPRTSQCSSSNFGLNEDRYQIDPDNPGIVLIINQEHFYTEPDEKYQHLLHKDNDKIKLETRDGTQMDKDKLEKVFKRYGFRIIIEENLTHCDIIKAVKDVTLMAKNESSLIVCILSHGDNGVIYGSNSCEVQVTKIQNIMCKRNKLLLGKPKVLILQSCQGKQCQKIEEEITDDEDEEDNNTKDGANVVPSTADLLTFWATIPGYAAIRNIKKGTWLIQDLCDEIEQASSRIHFLDICTRVVNKVTSKEWKEKMGTNVMTPMVIFTLRKAFYLPEPRNDK